jgi:thiol-disulfide isomerase/thioredoxin
MLTSRQVAFFSAHLLVIPKASGHGQILSEQKCQGRGMPDMTSYSFLCHVLDASITLVSCSIVLFGTVMGRNRKDTKSQMRLLAFIHAFSALAFAKAFVLRSPGTNYWVHQRRTKKIGTGALRMNELNNENYGQLLVTGETVLVDACAKWCGPCKLIEPILAETEKKWSNKIQFVKMDVDEISTSLKMVRRYGKKSRFGIHLELSF